MPRPLPRDHLLCIVLLAAAVLGGGIFHAPAAMPNYLIRTWQVEGGLPQNKVTAVVQTRDGYLWLGTYSGLARFDGVHFTVFDDNNTPELRSSRVTSLCEGNDGTLWIGDESGQVTQYKDGKWTEDLGPAPWDVASVTRWIETKRGVLVVGRTLMQGGAKISPFKCCLPQTGNQAHTAHSQPISEAQIKLWNLASFLSPW